MKIHVGTSGYAYKEWKGKFYPEKTSSKEMLHFYSARLSAVEINNTFYRMPAERTLISWAQQVPEDFVFAIKAPQIITHVKRLKNVDAEAEHLFQMLAVLDGKQGPILFQFPASYKADRAALTDFLSKIPSDLLCTFEFRNSSWFNTDILRLLSERQCCLCIADTDEKPANEIISTASWGYFRLRRSYSKDDLLQWRDKILSQGWERVYVFFKHEEEARGPEMAMCFNELLSSIR